MTYPRACETRQMLHHWNSLCRARRQLSVGLAHALAQSRPDDAYVVSYPRSGNTWMRTVLAAVVDPRAATDPDLRNSMVPGVAIRKAIRLRRLPSPRLLKSHTCFRPGLSRVLYIARDGRDVLVSLYHYLVTRRGKGDALGFAEFFGHYSVGRYGPRWHENVESWLGPGHETMGERLKVVRFEDMKSDTARVMTEACRFLRIDASAETVRAAAGSASQARMRAIERERRGELANREMSFYRGGASGQWADYLAGDIEERFCDMSARAMSMAGYEL